MVIDSINRAREAAMDRAREGMSAAYELLVRTANRNRTSLTATAEEIVTGAQRRPTPL